MVARLLERRGDEPLTILDPCVGPGTFVTALRRSGQLHEHDRIVALDVDPAMVARVPAGRMVETRVADFLQCETHRSFDAVVMNPPYVRQEWLDDKSLLRERARRETGMIPPGSSNLYVYFLVKAVAALKHGGRMCAVVYDSWRHTKYGQWLQRYLRSNLDELVVDDIADAPFDGRLIDATILSGTRREPRPDQSALDDRRAAPGAITADGLQPIGELYDTRRGLRLKQTNFFLCSRSESDDTQATAFVKRIRHIEGYSVDTDHPEAALLVIDGELDHPALDELRRRLREARQRPAQNRSILTWAKERPHQWFAHRKPPVAPLLVNYFLRGRPRHLFNGPHYPYSDNFYGLTPRDPVDIYAHLALLNCSATAAGILVRARNQGAGLRKIQLFEYRTALMPSMSAFTADIQAQLTELGRRLALGHVPRETLRHIDVIVAAAIPELKPARLRRLLTSSDWG